MQRKLFFLYGVFAHLLFFGVFAYMAAFVGGFLVPKTIDTKTPDSTLQAILIDVFLLLLFAVPHSVMARPAFKKVWTRIVPTAIERTTYVFIANLVMILLLWQWRSVDIVVWDLRHPLLRAAVWILFGAGWLMVPLASLMINHFDLFGTRQVYLNLKGKTSEALPFRTPHLYKQMRHPLYVGWIIAFWSAPTMTVGHLLFAFVFTAYIVIATFVEERDLVNHFGQQYQQYQRRVPRFIPRITAPKIKPDVAVGTTPLTPSH
jgi:protein-S-isoprenylcysteine O-methyltransferase Ste14